MLQNVPIQSPARLGLPNPNSPAPPKFSSSQIVQSHHSHQQSNTAGAVVTTTSPALLPLLPPLPRAQSLLVQMASLASRLFEVSPSRAHWLSAFRGSLPSFLSSQTQTLAPVPLDASPSSAKEIIALFTTLQTQLFEAVAELQEILDLQDAKQKIIREIRVKDSAVLGFANKLREAEQVLDELVDDYSDYRHLKRAKLDGGDDETYTTSVATRIKVNDILSYAHRISYTTFAPPEFGAGQVPLRGALPPAPQEEQMRASQLYAFADLDVGISKTVEDNETMIEPLIQSPATQPSESALANMATMQGMIPPNFVIPSGWKPGMPVELPIIPPPGWKPGDPVALPPFDSISGPSLVDEQPARPIIAPGISKAPEPIQVRHVQLDIEDDSDYTSDEASSDDDED
ncbi:hypothetical protein DCAR_0102598 [Daucus carota subsp. sativus]|uniref:Mediator of RNA polymerase II transcription subunit 4 n=1 Tax=Daucus carota subsp. sativus TaxID=79200 RepID=A0A169WSK8_DAUCS|nr:PREDICTED: mediator of RNA polymerase II transcription subunit 4-like [Daucus carota subsp. sativus]XP_017237797.1 PREDICTED: mediator of RNA polymerase II transcription subunit 4-like [Daucus carota subsp. sativus]XP_017237803.1 PREDICTED: mediator of RNA polymerase II transcription subunit 4-like [Daucus carota subsp. sativus]WOG83423.1 hypothetical protein DCAR_0102598 [Daucus carota subsp. sativus]